MEKQLILYNLFLFPVVCFALIQKDMFGIVKMKYFPYQKDYRCALLK